MQTTKRVKFTNPDKSNFYPTLKKRVDQYFKDQQLSKHANGSMVLKTVILLLTYLVPFVLLLIFQPDFGLSLLLWFIMGLGIAGIGMSIMHDANHGAYSENKTINYLVGHSLNLVGGSVFNWKLQHNILHHTYTNIAHIDEDIQDRLVLRFSPHTLVKKYHQLQYIYAFFFYGLLTLYWVLAKDFIQFIQFTKKGVNPQTKKENTITILKIIASKIFYFLVIFGVPVLMFDFSFAEVLVGFLLMHFTAGIILTVVFQLAHTVEGTSHPLPNSEGNIENDWAIHQLNTTVNFSPDNKFIGWYVGGLNYQIEHHLFPRVCHVHYPQISGIVKATAAEYGIPYMVNPTFMQALKSHLATLHRFGRLPDWNTAIG